MAAILDAILNISNSSTMPAGHRSDSDSMHLPLPKSAKICLGGIFRKVDKFPCRTISLLSLKTIILKLWQVLKPAYSSDSSAIKSSCRSMINMIKHVLTFLLLFKKFKCLKTIFWSYFQTKSPYLTIRINLIHLIKDVMTYLLQFKNINILK